MVGFGRGSWLVGGIRCRPLSDRRLRPRPGQGSPYPFAERICPWRSRRCDQASGAEAARQAWRAVLGHGVVAELGKFLRDEVVSPQRILLPHPADQGSGIGSDGWSAGRSLGTTSRSTVVTLPGKIFFAPGASDVSFRSAWWGATARYGDEIGFRLIILRGTRGAMWMRGGPFPDILLVADVSPL